MKLKQYLEDLADGCQIVIRDYQSGDLVSRRIYPDEALQKFKRNVLNDEVYNYYAQSGFIVFEMNFLEEYPDIYK
jgi:hypothetical protein